MRALLRRSLEILDKRGRLQLAQLAALILLNTILELATVGLVFPFLALLNNPDLIQSNGISHALYETLGIDSSTTFLALIGIGLFILVVLKNVYLYWLTRRQAEFGYFQAARVSEVLFSGYLSSSLQTHLNRNSADMITTADYSVDAVFSQVILSFLVFVTDASVVLALIAFLLVAEPYLTLTIIAVMGTCSVALVVLFRKELATLGEQGIALRIARLKVLQQALTSVKELKVLGREHFFLNMFHGLRQRHAANQARATTLLQLPRQVIEVVAVGGLLLVIVLILLQGRPTTDMIAVMGLFAIAAFRIMPALNRMLNAYNAIINGRAAVDEVSRDLGNAASATIAPGGNAKPLPFNDSLELRDVSFAYEAAPSPAVKGVSLTIRSGESVAFVGASGAGKSTLVDIILGLLPPQQGHVLVDGRDVFVDARQWRQLIGYVPQAISLVDDTLRNNVAFGVETAEIDETKVWTALTQANLHRFCETLPAGLETVLGERGVRLSGGQRQRVGIARALYGNPAVLVLDEATSALDNESEHEITSALEAVRGEKTLITIAHRLSTVKRCDRLFFMREGQIADAGTFAELMSRCHEFRDMVHLAELIPPSESRSVALD